jgi:hypothetical protein
VRAVKLCESRSRRRRPRDKARLHRRLELRARVLEERRLDDFCRELGARIMLRLSN